MGLIGRFVDSIRRQNPPTVTTLATGVAGLRIEVKTTQILCGIEDNHVRISAEQARRLAATLAEAADRLDAMLADGSAKKNAE